MPRVSHEWSTPAAPLDGPLIATLERFVHASRFTERGSIVTDLDGTAVHEDEGKIVIPRDVELALMRLVELGRPLVLNTLRFPLSVIRSFGRDWYEISKAPLPTITLNGSMLGRIVEARGRVVFEEIACFPLHADEIDRALAVVEAVLDDGASNVLVFYYPRDWRMGELIWTPDPELVMPIKDKYVSASAVTAVELPKLRAQLTSEDICMLFVLLDLPHDRLMAYQHTKQSMFFTSRGVDKLSGLQALARHLDIDLTSGLGAGDTEMDGFLTAMGCAVIVGSRELPYWGIVATLRVPDSPSFGQLLRRLAELHGSQPP